MQLEVQLRQHDLIGAEIYCSYPGSMSCEFDCVGADSTADFKHVFATMPFELSRFPKMFVIDIEPLIGKLVEPRQSKRLLFRVPLLRNVLLAPVPSYFIQCDLIAHLSSQISKPRMIGTSV